MNWSTSTRSSRPQPKDSAIDHTTSSDARLALSTTTTSSAATRGAEQRGQRGRHGVQLVGHLGRSLVRADLRLELQVGPHPIERVGRQERRTGVVEVGPGGHEALPGPGDESGIGGVEHRAIQAGTPSGRPAFRVRSCRMATGDATLLPVPCLVVLVGPSASGKSTWAEAQFEPDEIVSSDRLRAVVGHGEDDLDATADAFALLDTIVDRRLSRGLPR